MQWWNDFSTWFDSGQAQSVLYTAVVLFVGIVAAGLLAGLIARGAIKRVVAQRDREQRTAAVVSLIDAATEASVWNSLTPQEQVLADRAVAQADTHVRLLPIRGSAIAANWAAHQLHELKRASATFGYQLDPALSEFRDRLLEWQRHPGRTKRTFQADLDRWRSDATRPETALVHEQDQWVAEQHRERFAEGDAFAAATPVPPMNSETSADAAPTTPPQPAAHDTEDPATTPTKSLSDLTK